MIAFTQITSSVLILIGLQGAKADEALPEVCRIRMALVAKALSEYLQDGSFGDKVLPTSIPFKLTTSDYEYSKIQRYACPDEGKTEFPSAKPTWCQVAGGIPQAYQAAVSERKHRHKSAVITAVFNRGSCEVVEVGKP